MSRKNRRRIYRKSLGDIQAFLERDRTRQIYFGKCAYCGRELGANDWHWMRDEFGQRVRKCNNERRCYAGRRPEADEAFKRALRK